MIIEFTVYVSLKFIGEYIFLCRYISCTDLLFTSHRFWWVTSCC